MFREKVNDNLLAAMCKALRTTMTVAQGDAVRFITAECDAAGVTDARAHLSTRAHLVRTQ